jgi:septal ring factor EnvC (AmiA/AmiB activator)
MVYCSICNINTNRWYQHQNSAVHTLRQQNDDLVHVMNHMQMDNDNLNEKYNRLENKYNRLETQYYETRLSLATANNLYNETLTALDASKKRHMSRFLVLQYLDMFLRLNPDSECMICYEKLTKTNSYLLRCGHVLCKTDIARTGKKCPLCRDDSL